MRAVRALAGIAAAAAVVLAAGAADAARPPETPAGRQLAWVLETVNAPTPPTGVELAGHFTPVFLQAVPTDRLAAAFAELWAARPIRLAKIVVGEGDLRLQAQAETAAGATYRISVAVAEASPHPIEGLVFQLVASPLGSWQAVDGALRRLAARPGLYAARVGGGRLHALAAQRPAAIGSAFKLYVLGALADAVAHRRASWGERLAIRDDRKSLPSGAMRDEPAGTRHTLRHFAEQMISVSDNTATDHLIGRLGRGAVAAQLRALGNDVPERNEPFLTTREIFALKLAAPASLRSAFARAGTAERRRLLPRVDALRPTLAQAVGWRAPREIGRIEWFASPASLAHAIATLGRGTAPVRGILALNPGVSVDRSTWRYVAFKGGSEQGVLCFAWYLERRDGRAFVLTLVLNDERRAVDAAAAVSTAEAAIDLLAYA